MIGGVAILFTVLQSLDPALFSNFVLLGDFNIDFYNPGHHLYSKLHSLLWYVHVCKSPRILTPVFFNLQKVFDSVPHRPLVHKREELGVDRYIC